ncbi:hypothetical protein M0813_24248 [Anaeramoeba flamelloides]|uniref:Uncharacterized protein n=1 Tax=Anaeramoeba flamelloides TaxID=1746091 RepID=A0ABQ8Y603_9EUKA|nr:hypothetical protein M0813_24248 [Anaeramoeba flamelloides]
MSKNNNNYLFVKKKNFNLPQTKTNDNHLLQKKQSSSQKNQEESNLLLKSRTWKSNLIVSKKDSSELKKNITEINSIKNPINKFKLISQLIGKNKNNFPGNDSLSLVGENFTQIIESDEEFSNQEKRERDLITEIIEKDGTDIAIHLYILDRLNKITLVIEQFKKYLNEKQEKNAKYLAEVIVSIFLELEYLTPYAESQVADSLGLYDENITDKSIKQNIREECENLSLKNYFVSCSYYSLQIAEGLWKYLSSENQPIYVQISERINLLKDVIQTSRKTTSLFIDLLEIDIKNNKQIEKKSGSSLSLNINISINEIDSGTETESESENVKSLEEINDDIFKIDNINLQEKKKKICNKKNIQKSKRLVLPPPPNYPPSGNN